MAPSGICSKTVMSFHFRLERGTDMFVNFKVI